MGWFLYNDLTRQPQLTKDFTSNFIDISSSHLYTFLILSIFGILSYSKHKKLNLLIKYLIILSVVLELSHLLIPQRSFQFGDLFGNILGAIFALFVYRIWRIKL